MIIIFASGDRRHVAGGVRRHVAAAGTRRAAATAAGVRRLPHASDGRVRTVGTGQRSDAHQHVGVGHVSGARVARAEKKQIENDKYNEKNKKLQIRIVRGVGMIS